MICTPKVRHFWRCILLFYERAQRQSKRVRKERLLKLEKKVEDLIAKDQRLPSMSQKGNCMDNSITENFFGRLKVEMYYGENLNLIGDSLKSRKITYVTTTTKEFL